MMGLGVRQPQPSPASFLPPHLSGCALWLRSDDVGIVLAGSKVDTWPNRGSLGGNFTQSTDANRPTFAASDPAFQDLPSLSFDDVDDVLVSTLAASSWNFLHDGSGATVAAVIRPTGGGAFLSTINTSAGSGFQMDWNHSVGNEVQLNLYNATAIWRTVHRALASATKASAVARMQTGASPVASLHVNGVEGTLAGAGTAGGSADHTLTVGAWTAAAALPFGGKITEVVAYSRYLSSDELGLLEAYLAGRYAL